MKSAAELETFLTKRMVLRELYQPWVVLYLIASDGKALLDDIADNFPAAVNDSSKRLDVRKRLKQAVEDVLEGAHGIVSMGADGLVTLNYDVSVASPVEKIRLMSLCLSARFEGKTFAAAL